MSSITTIKMLRTVDIKLIPNHFFALCISIIMLTCANTCIAQETEQFKLVKNVTELQEGDIVIVVNNIVRDNGHCSALGTTLSKDKSKINILIPYITIFNLIIIYILIQLKFDFKYNG